MLKISKPAGMCITHTVDELNLIVTPCNTTDKSQLWEQQSVGVPTSGQVRFVHSVTGECSVRVFRRNFALEDAIGSHACSLEALHACD
jgi:hypothetical protein